MRDLSPASIRIVWVDATYHKVRVDGRVTSQATIEAIGICSDGERHVLGLDVGPSVDRAFWTASLRSLVKRGLHGVRLIVSDAHEGLKQAIATCPAAPLGGAAACISCVTCWRRCRRARATAIATIAAIVRTIFAQDFDRPGECRKPRRNRRKKEEKKKKEKEKISEICVICVGSCKSAKSP